MTLLDTEILLYSDVNLQDNPIGKGTGVYKNRRLFEAKKGHASLVPLEGLVKISSSIRNQSDTSSPQSLNTPSSYGKLAEHWDPQN